MNSRYSFLNTLINVPQFEHILHWIYKYGRVKVAQGFWKVLFFFFRKGFNE